MMKNAAEQIKPSTLPKPLASPFFSTSSFCHAACKSEKEWSLQLPYINWPTCHSTQCAKQCGLGIFLNFQPWPHENLTVETSWPCTLRAKSPPRSSCSSANSSASPQKNTSWPCVAVKKVVMFNDKCRKVNIHKWSQMCGRFKHMEKAWSTIERGSNFWDKPRWRNHPSKFHD